jgi:hypothetical protein
MNSDKSDILLFTLPNLDFYLVEAPDGKINRKEEIERTLSKLEYDLLKYYSEHGYYLNFGGIRNNCKSISSPMANIIREVLPEVEQRGHDGWKLKKKHVARLAQFTNMLLNKDKLLENYIESHKNGFDNTFEKHHDFTTALIDMVKYIYAKWE